MIASDKQGPSSRLQGTDRGLMSPPDSAVLMSAVSLMAVSVILVPVLMEFADMAFLDAVSVMTVPFTALGVYGYILRRHYLLLSVFIALSAAAFVADPKICLFVAVVTLGSEGVSVLGTVLQRLTFFRVCHRLEFHSTKHKKDAVDRVVGFVFDVPKDYDTRNLVMDPHVLRNRFPFRETFKVMVLALLFSMFVWLTVPVSPGYGDVVENVPAMLTFAVYAVMLSMPFFVLASVNLGLRSGRKVLNVSESMYAGVVRMLSCGLLALLVLFLFSGADADGLLTIAVSALSVSAVSFLSCIMYCLNEEASLVRDIASIWGSELPLGRMEEKKDGCDGGFGVPGTPERDCRSCYRDQRDQ